MKAKITLQSMENFILCKAFPTKVITISQKLLSFIDKQANTLSTF